MSTCRNRKNARSPCSMKVRRCRLLGCQDGNYAVRSCLVWDRHATFQKAARNLWHAHGLNGIPPSFSTCFATSGEVEVPFPIKPKALKVLSKLSDLKHANGSLPNFPGNNSAQETNLHKSTSLHTNMFSKGCENFFNIRFSGVPYTTGDPYTNYFKCSLAGTSTIVLYSLESP
jgi:hypothetical protein